MSRLLAISDIHGCANTFTGLLDKISLTKEDELYLLGDYIDRGPRSKAVLDKIVQLRQDGYKLHCLRGNHEQMMLEAPQSHEYAAIWLRNGGREVMQEFNTEDFSEIPDKYYNFLSNLSYYFDRGDQLFVHAGFKMSEDNPLEDRKPMLWIRKWEEQPGLLSWLQGRTVVHGHTPQTEDAIRERFDNLDNFPILNIDNGCCFMLKEGYHQLCCVDLTNKKLYFQPNID